MLAITRAYTAAVPPISQASGPSFVAGFDTSIFFSLLLFFIGKQKEYDSRKN
jgi:hypothetical protein